MAYLSLELKLSVRNTVADEVFRLQAYTCVEKQSHQASRLVEGRDKTVLVYLTLPTNPDLYPKWVHLDLYTIANDMDNFRAQVLTAKGMLALGAASIAVGVQVPLYDYENQLQGTVSVTRKDKRVSFNVPLDTALVYPSEPQRKVAATMVAEVAAAYAKLQASSITVDMKKQFVSFETPGYTLPVLAYVAAACRIDKEDSSEDILWHWFQVAAWLNGQHVDWFERASPYERGEWLVDLSGLVFRGLLYCKDYVRKAGGFEQESDQWNNVSCAPPHKLAGFDCEDGAAFMVQLVTTIQSHGGFKHEPLQVLQQWLRNYVPFLTLGDIKTSDGYSCHAFCVLLDVFWVYGKVTGSAVTSPSVLPAVVLESTVYAEGVWGGAPNTKQQEDLYSIGESLLHEAQLEHRNAGGSSWRRVVKGKAPLSRIKAVKLYRGINALVANNFPGLGAVHLLCIDERRQAVGVEPEQLLLYSSDVKLVKALVVEQSRKQELELLVNEMPFVSLPRAPPRGLDLHDMGSLSACDIKIFVRGVDFSAYDVQLKETLNDWCRSLTLQKICQAANYRLVHLDITDTVDTTAIIVTLS